MKDQLKQLKKVINLGKLGHAYLFYGKNNEELFDFALSFSAFLLKEKDKSKLQKNLEFHLINSEDEEEIKIEKIRKLINFLALSSKESAFKVSLIKDADKMNKNAANALLKVLEEPKTNRVIILTSARQGFLLPTITSRLQKIKLLTKQQKNVINNSKLADQLFKIIFSEIFEKFDQIEKISKNKNITLILDFWLSFFHDLLYLKAGCKILIKNSSLLEFLNRVSEKYSNKDIEVIIKEILNTKNILRNTNANIRLVLENLVLTF